MLQKTGAFAEFERSMIRQRINSGLKRAKAAGRQLRDGRAMKIAAELGVGSRTVQRVKREMEEAGHFGGAAAA